MSLEALAKAPLFAVTYKESLGISWEDPAEAILIEILATILIIPTATFLIIRFYQARKLGRIWSVSSVVRQTLSDRRAFPAHPNPECSRGLNPPVSSRLRAM